MKATNKTMCNNAQTDVTTLLQASGVEGNAKNQDHYVKSVISIT